MVGKKEVERPSLSIMKAGSGACGEVIGIASPASHNWLPAHGIKPVAYAEGLFDRLREDGPRLSSTPTATGTSN
jgi:hypothetical protein